MTTLAPEFTFECCQQNAPRKILLQVFHAGKMVGQALVDVEEERVFLVSLHVNEQFRRRGIGTFLMEETRSRWPKAFWHAAGTKVSDGFYGALEARGMVRQLGDGYFCFADGLI